MVHIRTVSIKAFSGLTMRATFITCFEAAVNQQETHFVRAMRQRRAQRPTSLPEARKK